MSKNTKLHHGVGALNPLENDPNFETMGIGSPILVNGAQWYVLGTDQDRDV
ncbi:MAG: hypothetical protein E4G98_04215 [Promethearchaeota archaeon]|nr:MAG: hypothetical protein E4G98_04215 [Candidatus Lokiarchaeota archaeon]